MIAGFVIEGSNPKNVLIQGIGKELSTIDTSLENELLQNPQITLIPTETSADKFTYIINFDWDDTDAETIALAQQSIGAFSLHADSGSSAILTTLSPGSYTIILSDQSNQSGGVALIEIYDLD